MICLLPLRFQATSMGISSHYPIKMAISLSILSWFAIFLAIRKAVGASIQGLSKPSGPPFHEDRQLSINVMFASLGNLDNSSTFSWRLLAWKILPQQLSINHVSSMQNHNKINRKPHPLHIGPHQPTPDLNIQIPPHL